MKKLTLVMLLMFLGTTLAIANNQIVNPEPINVSKSKLNGKWKASIETPDGNFEFTVDYKVEGKKLSGTFSSDQGELSFTDGTISGNNFEYSFDLDGVRYTHKGKLNGDTVLIQYTSTDKNGEFTMKKVKK